MKFNKPFHIKLQPNYLIKEPWKHLVRSAHLSWSFRYWEIEFTHITNYHPPVRLSDQ